MNSANSGAPGQSTVANWAANYSVVHPVLADPSGETIPYVLLGYPTYVVIDRNMVIVEEDMWPYSTGTISSYF